MDSEYKVIFGAIVFIGAFAFIASQFNTSFVSGIANTNYTAVWNGTLYNNATAGTMTIGAIPSTPICTVTSNIDLIGGLGCLGAYIVYYWDILTFTTTDSWLQILIFVPILAVLGYVVIRLLRDVIDLLPFT